ncbi:MAG: helix-turn-helix domain-containing protein [Clostridiales bacterium]|nr:helix-turn-helix domain-containing protein [Clostridiales bacterium]
MENHIDENNLDERSSLPYPVIEAAVNGSYEAVEIVLRSFESYIRFLSARKLYDKSGRVYVGIDIEIYNRLRSKLMQAILTSFKL